jgi:hypothetical protein
VENNKCMFARKNNLFLIMIIFGLNVSENVYSGHTCEAKKVLSDLVIFLIYELVKVLEFNLLNVKICR